MAIENETKETYSKDVTFSYHDSEAGLYKVVKFSERILNDPVYLMEVIESKNLGKVFNNPNVEIRIPSHLNDYYTAYHATILADIRQLIAKNLLEINGKNY